MTTQTSPPVVRATGGEDLVPRRRRRRAGGADRPNAGGMIAALVWGVFVVVPLYYLLAANVQTQSEFITGNPLRLPSDPTLENYAIVLDSGFLTFFANTVVVTGASVAIVLGLGLPAAYAIIRNRNPLVQRGFTLMLIGLAIPAQAVIIPVYLLITQLRLYDTLVAIILPTAAFSMPVSMLVLTASLRDIPGELYEAQEIDGARPFQTLRTLVLPMARPALATAGIFTALQAWNGFIFPLVLTQSPDLRVLTLGLYEFQGQFSTNIPALLTAVTLSVVPIFLVYLLGRRFLLSGLTAGFSK
jgi:raffinose/stachyose/melibiose transport system permease protein/xylobiose transport system permease protein